jgi:hypothetical protein
MRHLGIRSRLLRLALVLAACAFIDPLPGAAQTPPPLGEVYGRRLVVPLPEMPTGTGVDVIVASGGWVDTTLAVVVLGPGEPVAQCPAPFDAGQVLAVDCGTRVPANGLVSVPVPSATGAGQVMLYALANETADAACAELEDLSGPGGLAGWELDQWQPGEPLAGYARLVAGGDETQVTARSVFRALASRAPAPPASLGLPLPGIGARGRVASAAHECLTVNVLSRAVPAAPDDCSPPAVERPAVRPFGSTLAPAAGAGGGGMVVRAPGDLAGVAGLHTNDGWLALAASPVTNGTTSAVFPLAAGIVPELQSELWVTSQAVTATSTIEITMTDGNGRLHKLFTDPDPLCAGGTRSYDVDALAGTIPPTGRGGPPMVSLRVSSLAVMPGTQPTLAAGMVFRTPLGMAAYAGLNDENPLTSLGRRDDIAGSPVVVVPDIVVGHGTPATTSYLLLSSVRAGGNAARAFIDFYDEAGQLVVEGAFVQARAGAGSFYNVAQGFQNLGGQQLTLPRGFRGLAVVRPENARTALAAMVLNLPLTDAAPRPLQAGGDVFDVHFGAYALRGPNPNAPTATPTETPFRATPTATPTRTIITDPSPLYLPFAVNRP